MLDTHVWLWWINADNANLDKEQWRLFVQRERRVGVSAISCFEVAWLECHNRIRLKIPLALWFEKATVDSGIEILPISPAIAELAANLSEHHSDPQDRLIIATAIVHKAKLLSADKKFAAYDELGSFLMPIPSIAVPKRNEQ